MELWIRSKCGKMLVIAKDFLINDNNCIIVNGIAMGDYKSEQRAIEVLNEIQKLLDSEYDFELYQMPQE